MNPIITLDLVFLTLSHRLDVTRKQLSQYPTILAATEILKKKTKKSSRVLEAHYCNYGFLR